MTGAPSNGRVVTPTLIDEIDHDATAVHEEIAGPAPKVFTWSDDDDTFELPTTSTTGSRRAS